MVNELSGKVAIVTGGAKGLGRAISIELAAKGAVIALIDINNDEGNRVCHEIIKKKGKAHFYYCDIRKESDIIEMVEKVVKDLSRIDILINNAGIGAVMPTWELPVDVWDNILDVNLRGTFLCCKHVIPYMIKQKTGKVINISSAVGKQAQPLLSAYAVSKAGQIALTVALAKEVADYGITVNAVCPGPINTSWWDEPKKILARLFEISEEEVVNKFTQEKQIIKVPIKPQDVANVVCWLSSSKTDLITGQAISIDGGHEFPTY